MKKELFKILANKVANQDSLPALIDVITESDVFCEEELDNVIFLLLGVYKLLTIKSYSKISNYNDRVNLTFISFNKVKMTVTYSYQCTAKVLVHEGQELTRWEASKKGLDELYEKESITRVRPEVNTDTCSLERWTKGQFGDVVTLK
jgi:hypothetical protein